MSAPCGTASASRSPEVVADARVFCRHVALRRLTEGSRNQPCVTQDYNANDPKLKAFWDRIFKQFALKQRLTVLSLVCSDWAQRVRLMPAEVVVSVPDGDIDILRQLQYWLLDYGYLVTGMDVKAEPHVWTSEQLGSGRAGEDARPVLKLVCSDLIGKTRNKFWQRSCVSAL